MRCNAAQPTNAQQRHIYGEEGEVNPESSKPSTLTTHQYCLEMSLLRLLMRFTDSAKRFLVAGASARAWSKPSRVDCSHEFTPVRIPQTAFQQTQWHCCIGCAPGCRGHMRIGIAAAAMSCWVKGLPDTPLKLGMMNFIIYCNASAACTL